MSRSGRAKGPGRAKPPARAGKPGGAKKPGRAKPASPGGKAVAARKPARAARGDAPTKATGPARSNKRGKAAAPRKAVPPGKAAAPRKAVPPGKAATPRKAVPPGRAAAPRRAAKPGKAATPSGPERLTYTLDINGRKRVVEDAWYFEDLLSVLRNRLGLTGTKFGCEHGQCGACTVHVDGKPVYSCLELAAGAVGRKIVTIEGYNRPDGSLTDLQKAFVDHAALQCGYCTPGFIMAASALLADRPNATEEEIREGLDGNLCRCTGYRPIIDAIRSVAGGPHEGR